ncbi:hypothetical protein Q6D67_08610 [Haliea sp. E1-2-M8]|uniref:hypothetical protein n=1 Tax=Haliea sp. E1-2-M8 TaxID=3064706 RepID=UPI0027167269|nr:hypothetical protein [Haliea sp. E1-2-M8]MDO8861761.1 hypothetical protein [Haliea sp. E1-2-M8]
MADENTTSETTTAATGSKTAPKRAYTKRKAAPKTAAARKAPTRQRAPSKSAAVKTVEKVETKARTYKRRATKAATAYERDAEKAANKLSNRARTVSRNAFLASLGFYGKAYDEMQARLDRLQTRLDARGKAANVAYAELVKRGSKVEDDAWSLITDLELDAMKDRKKLDARLAKARARFNELRSSVGFRSAA